MKQSLRFPVCLVCWIGLGGIAALPAFAQNRLDVLEPRQSWFREPGTIEAATIEVRPKGSYAEVGLDLIFSARNTVFDATDSLEVALYFTLPGGTFVTDSWLWVGDDIIRADIFDAWTASTIYENIVRRRRDPSVLFKRGPRDYELRIFPMAAHETRRVKLTYLVPTQWTARAVTVPLPAEVLHTSWHTIPAVKVRVWPDATWRAPPLVSG